MLRAAAEHRGSALVEIYQNCPIFNDGAFDVLKESGEREERLVPLRHGEPIRFGAEGQHGVARDPKTGSLKVVEVAEVGEENLVVHDAPLRTRPTRSRCPGWATTTWTTPSPACSATSQRATYDDLARHQVETAKAAKPADLGGLLRGKDTWTVLAD